MHNYRKITLWLFAFVAISACSDQNDSTISVGLSDDEGDSQLAEAVFCTAVSDELRNYSNPFKEDIKMWQATFNEIYESAQKQANALKDKDGAAVETRLNTISKQTISTLANLDKTGDKEGFSRFIEQTIQQCASFAS